VDRQRRPRSDRAFAQRRRARGARAHRVAPEDVDSRLVGAIEVRDLRKTYRRRFGKDTVAVAGVDLDVPTGVVYGFLGPNGSGKTTTIRCLLGLVRPDTGGCRILGTDVGSDLSKVIGRVGSIVETPTFF